MTKVLFWKEHLSSNRTLVVIILLVISIIIANSFIIFTFEESSRFYLSSLTTAVTSAIALTTALVMVCRYKKQQKRDRLLLQHPDTGPYSDNNMMHFSVCIFLALWFAAQVIWAFYYQQSALPNIADGFWLIGYGFFGYFLYNLYFRFFRKEFEPFILVLVAIVISMILIFVIDIILSTSRLLSTQKPDIYVLALTLAYPILDGILLFPAVLIFWAVRRISSSSSSGLPRQRQKQQEEERKQENSKDQKEGKGEGKEELQHTISSSIWLLLLSISMILFAVANSGFAFTSAYDPESVQENVWMWDIFYNSGYLCLATAMIGYKSFSYFK